MIQQFKNRNFYIILVGDLVLFAAALILAYGVRFSLEIPEKGLFADSCGRGSGPSKGFVQCLRA